MFQFLSQEIGFLKYFVIHFDKAQAPPYTSQPFILSGIAGHSHLQNQYYEKINESIREPNGFTTKFSYLYSKEYGQL